MQNATLPRPWKQVEKWTERSFKIKIALSVVDIICDIPIKNKVDSTCINFNFVILIGKWFIYRSKLNMSDLFIMNFLAELKSYAVIEKYIENTKSIKNESNLTWLTSLLESLG